MITKSQEKEIVEKFLLMCSESINPDLFVLLEEEIIPRLEQARHIKVRRIREIKKDELSTVT